MTEECWPVRVEVNLSGKPKNFKSLPAKEGSLGRAGEWEGGSGRLGGWCGDSHEQVRRKSTLASVRLIKVMKIVVKVQGDGALRDTVSTLYDVEF